MNEPTPKLPRAAEELLRDFPLAEPDFEAQAKAIEARIITESTRAFATPSGLLKPVTLAAEPGEPSAPASAVRAAAAPKSNFAEMARKSIQKQDDSVDIARELMAATARSRRPDAEMVERVRAAGRATAVTTPVSSREATVEEPQRPSGVVVRAEPVPQAAPTGRRGALLGMAGGALALAAGVALFLNSEATQTPTSAALAAERASGAAQAASEEPIAAAPVTKPGDVVNPEALAAAPQLPGPEGLKHPGKQALNAPTPAAASKPAAPPSASAKPVAVVLEDDEAAAKPEPIAVEEKREPAAPEPKLRPAEGNAGGVPLTPSAGAVSTALSSVRSSAQACLAGQRDPVRAVVTFAADGRVLRVSAGGPSASCIQAALSKASIAPFARDTFSATTTIRPP